MPGHEREPVLHHWPVSRVLSVRWSIQDRRRLNKDGPYSITSHVYGPVTVTDRVGRYSQGSSQVWLWQQIRRIHRHYDPPKTHNLSDRNHRLGQNGEVSYILDHLSCSHRLSKNRWTIPLLALSLSQRVTKKNKRTVARSIQSLLRDFILVNTLAQFSASTIAVQGTIVSGGDGQESELMRVNITLIFPGLSDTPLTSSPSTYEVSSYCGRLHSSMSLCFIWYHVTQYTARPAAHNCDVDSFCRSVWYLRLSQHYTARWPISWHDCPIHRETSISILTQHEVNL